jgi:hypothetical protein
MTPGRGQPVRALYADPERWGQRIGERLLDEAVNRLTPPVGEEPTSCVFGEDSRGPSFYAEHGFAADGVVKRPTPMRCPRKFGCGGRLLIGATDFERIGNAAAGSRMAVRR